MRKVSKQSGYRKAPGRKAEVTNTKRINVSLDPVTVEKARKMGCGNLSLGLRKAVNTSYTGE